MASFYWKTFRLELECSHYHMIADEAYKQLSEIKDRDLMSRSQVLRLGDWLELMEEVSMIIVYLMSYCL